MEINDDYVISCLEADDRHRVLRRLPMLTRSPSVDPLPGWKRAIILDTETTGLDTATAEVIEIALLELFFDENDEIADVGRSFTALAQPSAPLSDVVKRVTGLTDEELVGHYIDWEIVGGILSDAAIIIAHNAAFDRPIVERYCETAIRRPWACSSEELPWKDMGCPSRALECIAWFLGYFYKAHRAVGDVEALASILSLTPGKWVGDPSVFATLLKSARLPVNRVHAVGSPFDRKDALKARGYKWDANHKCWHFDIKDAPDVELEWLRDNAACTGQVERLTAVSRYRGN